MQKNISTYFDKNYQFRKIIRMLGKLEEIAVKVVRQNSIIKK